MLVKQVDRKKALVTAGVALCIGMLAFIGLHLTSLLQPSVPTKAPKPFAEDSTFGMVLLDITDAETAVHYHVPDPGVYVLAVEEGSQAEQAGIRSGDRIYGANGVNVSISSDLTAVQDSLLPGDTLLLALVRGTEEQTLTVALEVFCDVAV